MRRIRKSAEPAALSDWKSTIRPRGSIPPWRDFPDPPRGDVRRVLARDQGYLCCYCAGAITRGNFRIEHFRPRAGFRHLTYRWDNLLASCEISRAVPTDGQVIETQLHCDHAKANWFEEGVTVSPLTAAVNNVFRFTLLGKVFPSKALRTRKAHIQTIIDQLNLNAPILVARRYKILAQANADVATLSRTEWVARYLQPGAGGQFQEFLPALEYNYDKHWSGMLV